MLSDNVFPLKIPQCFRVVNVSIPDFYPFRSPPNHPCFSELCYANPTDFRILLNFTGFSFRFSPFSGEYYVFLPRNPVSCAFCRISRRKPVKTRISADFAFFKKSAILTRALSAEIWFSPNFINFFGMVRKSYPKSSSAFSTNL